MRMWRRRGECRFSWAFCAFLGLACGSSGGAEEVEVPVPASPAEPNDPSIPGPLVPPAELDCSELVPGAADARLLTRLQYDNTVRELLGETTSPARGFPAENTLLGFGNNANTHRATLLLAEGHLAAAEELAAATVARGVDGLLPCEAGDRSEACVESFIEEFGYRAFRRPLLESEGEPLLALFREASPEWGFETGIELVIQAFLQSPQLLYRTESLASSGESAVGSGVLPLDSYQIASRLSYLLWNTMPDAELFSLADAGQLTDVEVIRAQAERMLADERARVTVTDFYEQWLGLESFAGLSREIEGAESESAFNDSWRASLVRFVEHTFWDEGGNVESLLTSPSVFADPELAALYGLSGGDAANDLSGGDAANGLSGDATGSYLDPNRAGVLTQPGLMSLLAHADQSAPVQRGKFVREQLLCHQLPPPPPDVDTTPPDPAPDATTRERFREHSANQRCASCHRLLDPVGFGLESFDHIGRYRTEEYGIPVDTSGSVEDSTDPNLEGPFDGALELASKLAVSPQVEACLATQWFRYGMGRAEQTEDMCSLEQAKQDFAAAGGDFKQLLVALTLTDAFRYRAVAEHDL